MEGFRLALEECQLGDLGFLVSRCTWCNFQQDINFTKERLDQAVANGECCSRFQTVSIHVLATRTSDHTPLQVTFCVQSLELYSYRIGFKFEEKWTLDDEW
jgi:hypothetical protein